MIMKKSVLILLFILLTNLVSAVEIKLSKETYSPQETLQAEIYGNFLDTIKLENIVFYRERNIPVVYNFLKLKDKYILYALLPSKEGNYSFKIKNIRYEENSIISSSDIIKEFTIQSRNETIISINPGFIIARDDFYIKVKSNTNTNIETDFLGEKQIVPVTEGIEKKIYFSISEIKNYTETTLKIQDYNIPVFIFPEKSDEEIIEETGSFRFNPLDIEAVILKEESFFFELSLINLWNINIENIEISSNISDKDLNVLIEPDSVERLESKDEKTINITLSSNKNKYFSGNILAVSGNITTELAIKINVTENISEISYNSPVYVEKKCADIGKICDVREKCDQALEFTDDGYCCPGNCVAETNGSSISWIYGVLIIVALIAGLIALSFYMKKRQKPRDVLKEREKKYEQRMSGVGEEVRGSLTKI